MKVCFLMFSHSTIDIQWNWYLLAVGAIHNISGVLKLQTKGSFMGMRFVKNESDSLMVPLTIILVFLGNKYLEKILDSLKDLTQRVVRSIIRVHFWALLKITDSKEYPWESNYTGHAKYFWFKPWFEKNHLSGSQIVLVALCFWFTKK